MTPRPLPHIGVLLALILVTGGTAQAQDLAAAARANRASKEATKAEVSTANQWYSLTHASLLWEDVDGRSETSYQVSRNGDTKITLTTEDKGLGQVGEIMLINGQRPWMLTKNLPLEEGYEIDTLDGPVLNLKLVLALLRTAAPAGPGGITKATTVEVREDRRPITVSTASAMGGLEAPWTLRATIEPTAENEWSFDLVVDLPAEAGESLHVRGTWQKQATGPVLSDDTLLEGWSILVIGPIRRAVDEGVVYDYGAQPFDRQVRTLGELRKM